jgi:hypothetical protein
MAWTSQRPRLDWWSAYGPLVILGTLVVVGLGICALLWGSLTTSTKNCFPPYQTAVDMFEDGAYVNAAERFERYLKSEPNGENASRAQVYLTMCEIPFVSRELTGDEYFEKAVVDLERTTQKEEAYPELREVWDVVVQIERDRRVEQRSARKQRAAQAALATAAANEAAVVFTVSETAGIRRRSDVVTARLSVPDLPPNGEAIGFRLVSRDEAGKRKVVPAQFHVTSTDPPQVIVDFIANFQPLESQAYRLEFGPDVKSETLSGGLVLSENDEEFRVDNAGVVHWTLPRDLRGLLDFSWKETPYVANESEGLYWIDTEGQQVRLDSSTPASVEVSRQGPIATALRWTYSEKNGAASVVEMEFYRTKSWVHLTWDVNDSSTQVKQLGMDLNLELDGKEILIDYGGADFVYTTVRAGQSSLLVAGPRKDGNVPWKVMSGPSEAPNQVLAIGPPKPPASRVFGWAHAMDSERCTAVAVAKFASVTRDQIRMDGDGTMRVTRIFSDPNSPKKKRLELWMHFVTMPVHIGARTSPRSMQEPLQVQQ